MKGWTRGQPLRFRRGHANRTKQRPPLDRTDYRVEERGYETPCWIWAGTINTQGYGRVTIAGVSMYAHRAMYEQEVQPIPAGLDIDHLCRVPSCCHPSHLEPVTRAVNLQRGRGAKLSDGQIEAIRSDSRLLTEVAAAFGISPSYASRIRAGKARS